MKINLNHRKAVQNQELDYTRNKKQKSFQPCFNASSHHNWYPSVGPLKSMFDNQRGITYLNPGGLVGTHRLVE